MRSSIFLPLLLPLSVSALQVPSLFADFLESIAGNETTPQHDLLKRDGNCPNNFNSCSTLGKGDGGACCTSGSICTRDRARNIACCPLGATCTGTITLGTATGTGTGTGTSTGGFVLGGTTATTTTDSTVASTGSASLVSNSYFPFPYIPTTYANSAACNSAFSACSANYAACTAGLQGAAFGVTVVAPNGAGVTVAPTAQNLGSASASSICSSLSGVGCYGLQSSNCAQFGSGTATSTGVFEVATGTNGGVARSRVTVGPLLVAMGAGVGLMGMV